MKIKKLLCIAIAIAMTFSIASFAYAQSSTDDVINHMKAKCSITALESDEYDIMALVDTNDKDFSVISETVAKGYEMEIELTSTSDITCTAGGTLDVIEAFVYTEAYALKENVPTKIMAATLEQLKPILEYFSDPYFAMNKSYADFVIGPYPFILAINLPDPALVAPGTLTIELCAYDENDNRYVITSQNVAYDGYMIPGATDEDIVKLINGMEFYDEYNDVDTTKALSALGMIKNLDADYVDMIDLEVFEAIVCAESSKYGNEYPTLLPEYSLITGVKSGVYPIASAYDSDLNNVSIVRTFEEVTDYAGDSEEMKMGTIYNIDAVVSVNGVVAEHKLPVLVAIEANGPVTKIFHEDAVTGSVEEIPFVQIDHVRGDYVLFKTTTFSNFSVVSKADTIVINFVKTDVDENGDDNNEHEDIYDIVLSGQLGNGTFVEAAYINRLSTADLYFTFENTNEMIYEVIPGKNIDITTDDENPNRYMLSFDGVNQPDKSGKKITISSVKVSGYGEYTLGLENEIGNAKCLVTAAQTENNIVDYYYAGGKMFNTGDFALSYKPVSDEIKVPTRNLLIEVTFPNTIINNAASYQDMTVSIVGGDVDKTIKLGDNTGNVEVAEYFVSEDLPMNTAYTVTVEGAGYRTARYTVNLTDDKTLLFWNNVMDNDVYIEESITGEKKAPAKVTFLAGDIVKDNKINIYDLSAVVSYFGTENLVANHSTYAKYDLNRDGVIDSKDVAYVLVSWGK